MSSNCTATEEEIELYCDDECYKCIYCEAVTSEVDPFGSL